jgi:hypothetical protein
LHKEKKLVSSINEKDKSLIQSVNFGNNNNLLYKRNSIIMNEQNAQNGDMIFNLPALKQNNNRRRKIYVSGNMVN